jgi:hypothetical protein
VSGVGPQAMFEAGRRKSHGRRLFVMANVIEIFSCANCVPLIMMWSLDLLASLFTNDQISNSNKTIDLSEKIRRIAM